MHKPEPVFTSRPSALRASRSVPKLATMLAPLALAVALTACGNKEMVKGDNLALGASSLDMARAAGADEHAPVEMNKAREKIQRARRLLQDGDRVEAQRLAEEADVDAQLAHAKAESVRSAQSLAEVKQSIQALRNQAAQPQSGTPSAPSSTAP